MFRGGLCIEHFEKEQQSEMQRADALELLHRSNLDGSFLTKAELHSDFERVQKWWGEVCSYMNSQRNHPVLKDEIEFAKEWCISIAKSIIEEESAFRNAAHYDEKTNRLLRQQIWSRFENLEKGLMSNGVARPSR